jgi:hypothetical protein
MIRSTSYTAALLAPRPDKSKVLSALVADRVAGHRLVQAPIVLAEERPDGRFRPHAKKDEPYQCEHRDPKGIADCPNEH